MSHPVTLTRNALYHKDTILACYKDNYLMKQTCHVVGVTPHTLRSYCRVLGIPLWWQKHKRRKQP